MLPVVSDPTAPAAPQPSTVLATGPLEEPLTSSTGCIQQDAWCIYINATATCQARPPPPRHAASRSSGRTARRRSMLSAFQLTCQRWTIAKGLGRGRLGGVRPTDAARLQQTWVHRVSESWAWMSPDRERTRRPPPPSSRSLPGRWPLPSCVRPAMLSHPLCRLICILDAGFDVNAPLHLMPERTPLEAAATGGHLPLVAELLRRGADARHRTSDDLDAMTLAIQRVLVGSACWQP